MLGHTNRRGCATTRASVQGNPGRVDVTCSLRPIKSEAVAIGKVIAIRCAGKDLPRGYDFRSTLREHKFLNWHQSVHCVVRRH